MQHILEFIQSFQKSGYNCYLSTCIRKQITQDFTKQINFQQQYTNKDFQKTSLKLLKFELSRSIDKLSQNLHALIYITQQITLKFNSKFLMLTEVYRRWGKSETRKENMNPSNTYLFKFSVKRNTFSKQDLSDTQEKNNHYAKTTKKKKVQVNQLVLTNEYQYYQYNQKSRINIFYLKLTWFTKLTNKSIILALCQMLVMEIKSYQKVQQSHSLHNQKQQCNACIEFDYQTIHIKSA
eukprot:TRINITY_DN23555_c0_g1_i1.p1 TRINITY_DN23555_c0_g1~~TRINITY_DN23555_c0_g1_i1.p1  ORF type:complete len:237 (+),score=-7.63 TRINITY_DN23555_c0_g1_i1:167-877(+)